MRILVLGGNRFIGAQLVRELAVDSSIELHVVNRSGTLQPLTSKRVFLHKKSREELSTTWLSPDWDIVYDFSCYTPEHATLSTSFFKNIKLYVFISSAAVYDFSKVSVESDFNPHLWKLNTPVASDDKYLYGYNKRCAEAIFAQKAKFPVIIPRFPFVLGLAAKSEVLFKDIERIDKNIPIYIKNPDIKLSILHSSDAVNFLLQCSELGALGPINVTSSGDITMFKIIAIIESAVGKTTNLGQSNFGPHSFDGVDCDVVLDTTRLTKIGFIASATEKNLEILVAEYLRQMKKSR